MEDVTIARALHVLAVVHWIGGVGMVTAVILPALARRDVAETRLAQFDAIEGRFAAQAKYSVTITGLTGLYMIWRLDLWSRFLDLHYWWMHAMVFVWFVFTLVLFIAEPLFLHSWFHRRAAREPGSTFALIQRAHWFLFAISVVTVTAAVLGAHGVML